MKSGPWRYWTFRRDAEPSLASSIVLTLLAAFLTCLAIIIVVHPTGDNIPGDVILDAIFVALAVWVDRLTIQRWRTITLRWRRLELN